jgi:hypothetical protein
VYPFTSTAAPSTGAPRASPYFSVTFATDAFRVMPIILPLITAACATSTHSPGPVTVVSVTVGVAVGGIKGDTVYVGVAEFAGVCVRVTVNVYEHVPVIVRVTVAASVEDTVIVPVNVATDVPVAPGVLVLVLPGVLVLVLPGVLVLVPVGAGVIEFVAAGVLVKEFTKTAVSVEVGTVVKSTMSEDAKGSLFFWQDMEIKMIAAKNTANMIFFIQSPLLMKYILLLNESQISQPPAAFLPAPRRGLSLDARPVPHSSGVLISISPSSSTSPDTRTPFLYS